MAIHEPVPGADQALDHLLELICRGLGASRASVVEPGGTAVAVCGTPGSQVTERSTPLVADGSSLGTLVIEVDSESGLDERALDEFAAIVAAVLSARTEARDRARDLDLTRKIAEVVVPAEGLAEALTATVDAIFDRSSFSAVTATLADHESREQIIVADRGRQGDGSVGYRRPIELGLVGTVIASGEQLLVDRASENEAYTWEGDGIYESLLLTPVVLDGRCEAVLELTDRRPAQFAGRDATLMRMAADQLAANLRGVRLREESERRAQRLDVAGQVAEAVNQAETLEEALQIAARTVHRQAGYEWVGVTRLLPDTAERVQVAQIGADADEAPSVRRPLDEGLIGAAVREGAQISLRRLDAESRLSWPVPLDVESLVVTPIMVADVCVAAIDIADRRLDCFDRSDAALMAVVADHLAASWRSIVLRDESRKRAERLALAAEVAKLVAEEETVDDLLEAVARMVFDQTGVDCVTATAVDHERDEQVFVADATRDGQSYRGLRRPRSAGLSGRVIETGVQYLSGAAHRDPDYSWPGGIGRYGSSVITPVVVDGRCDAAIGMWERATNRFDATDAALMETVAEQVAVAIRAIRLRHQSSGRAQQLALTLEVARSVAAAHTVDDALRSTVDTIFEATAYSTVDAVRVQEGEQVLVAVRARDGERAAGVRRPLGAGMTGRVLASGEPLVALRTPPEESLSMWPGESVFASGVLMPVIVDGQPIAVLEVYSDRPDGFDSQDEVLMRTVGEQVAAAIRGVALREESERRAGRLALTAEVARLVAGASSLEDALERAARIIFEHGNYTSTLATLALPEAGEQVVVAEFAREATLSPGLRRPLSEGISGRTLRTGQQQIVPRTSRDPDYSWPGNEQWESCISTPVMAGHDCLAEISIYEREPDRYNESDALLMLAAAEQIGAALQAIRLRVESEQRAKRLALTADVAREIAGTRSAADAVRMAASMVYRTGEYDLVVAILVSDDGSEQIIAADLSVGETSFEEMRWPIGAGISGRVISRRAQEMVHRATADSDYLWPSEERFESLVLTPVLIGGDCVAVLLVGDRRPDRFDETHASLLRAVAEQVAASLRGVRLRTESEQRAKRLSVAAEVAMAVAGRGNEAETLRAALSAIARSITARAFTAFIAHPNTGEQECVVDLDGSNTIAGRRRPIGEGASGAVFTSGKQLVIGRTSDLPTYDPWVAERVSYESVLLTPVVVEGKATAVMGVYHEEPDHFGDEDALLLRTVAEQVAAALRGARLRVESDRRAERLAISLEVATAVADAPTVDDAIRSAVEVIADRIDCGSVGGFLAHPDAGEMLAVIDLDRYGATVEGLRQPLFAGDLGAVFESGEPVLMRSAADSTRSLRWSATDWQYESAIIMPVNLEGATVAVISLFDRAPSRFDDDDLVLMQTIAEQLAAALRGARLRAESERRAQRLGLMLDVARAIAASPTPEATLRAAVETIAGNIGCGAVSGVMATGDGEQLAVIDIDRLGGSVEGLRRPIEEGASGHVFSTGKQLRIGDNDPADGFVPWTDASWRFRSLLVTPVTVDGRTDAVIGLFDTTRDRFDADDAVVMQTVAEQVAAELRGARLRDESETRAQRLALTLEVAKGIAGADSVDTALSAVVDTIFERTTYKAVSAIRIDNESQEEIIAAERTRSGTSTLGMSRLLAPYGTGLAAVSRAQVLFEDTAGDPRYVPWKTSAGWSVALATPVLSGDTCEATLVLYEAAGEQLTEADQVIMRTVAEQVAAALRGIRLRDQSEARARRLEALEVRQRGLLERLVRAQERERSRVAGDLHDDTVQVLSACVIALDRVRQSIEIGNLQQATSNLRGVSELVSGAVDRTRRMTFELRPAVLWHNGLAPAVEHLLGTLGRETGSTTRLIADTLPARLDPTIETIAFRSISELISNIRNHASARSVEIRLDVRDGELVVEVADDGRGFDLSPALERARSTNHLGLESMTERIDAAGGWVDVETAPGSGTRVRFRLPVRESGDDPADRSRWAQ